MLPWVYGFEWTPGHLIFLGVFFTAILVAVSTLVYALTRAARDLKGDRALQILWREDFEELPAAARRCRHTFTGELPGRVCPLGFDCRECVMHATLTERTGAPAGGEELAGINIDYDRFYHRGHTWVKPQEDGTVLIGLDDLGRRLTGRPDRVELPTPGTALKTNSPAWEVTRNRNKVRVLSPVDGTVVEASATEPWTLKVWPDRPFDTRHLLRGAEVSAWFRSELERLQILAGSEQAGPALADGGVLVDDLADAFPAADWEAVCGQMMLDS
ncbi:MAG: hypothetical protein JNN08_15005 [Bryobacterales bacterium]|nr:hypothetical protein [Bryobacterales bacterium]